MPDHPGHAHKHVHPHPRGKHHHHIHRHPHKRHPSDLAHHHRLGRFRQPSVPFATRRVRRVWRSVYAWFPHAVNLGTFNCRKIAGSTSWSQHAWADAWDVASPTSAKTLHPDPYLDAVVAHLKLRHDPLEITRILYRVANHFSHAHVDVDPDRGGKPPCAG
jgi:hypothetical protein